MIDPVSLDKIGKIIEQIRMPDFSFTKIKTDKIIDIQKSLFEYQIRIELLTKGIDAASSTIKRLGAGQ